MAKHVYGFSADRDKEQAIKDAITMAKADGFFGDEHEFTVEILEDDEHKANHEFVVVLRTEIEGNVIPIATTVQQLPEQ